MKRMTISRLGIVCILSLSFLCDSQAAPALRLAGMVNLPRLKQALLQNVPGQGQDHSILKEGEREGDLEMVRIHPESGSVQINLRGKAETLAFNRKADSTTAVPTLVLEQAAFPAVLRWYASLANRNVLLFPSAESAALDLREAATDDKGLALAIERVLASNGIAAIPQGGKFVVIVNKDRSAEATQLSAPSASSGGDLLGPGMIQFVKADARQVVQFYAELVGRRFEPEESFKAASGAISFRNQTLLSRDEVRYALDTLFAWQGFRVEAVGEKSLRCVRLGASRQ